MRGGPLFSGPPLSIKEFLTLLYLPSVPIFLARECLVNVEEKTDLSFGSLFFLDGLLTREAPFWNAFLHVVLYLPGQLCLCGGGLPLPTFTWVSLFLGE